MENENESTLKEKQSKALAQKLIADAKCFASDGELYQSLKCFKKAFKLYPSEKTKSRIERIKQAIEEDEEDDDNLGFIELDNGLVIFKKLVERLYPHQIEGIKWLYDLFVAKKRGGILADDMGLGKTIQVIAFISAMFDMHLIKNILLVLPLSVIPIWQKEFENWAPGIKIECFHGPASKRLGILRQCMMKRSVCITTYGLIITQWKTLGESIHGDEFVWDYIILDEGHRIKNRSKTTKHLHGIPSKHRIILTGTPIQNRVRDMWALMDWVTQGSLLGTQKTFKHSYEIPIERARQKDATGPEIQLGNHMADSLRELTRPYILRRTKEELMMENKENVGDELKLADDGQDQSALSQQCSFPKLSTKNELVVWVYMSPTQEKIYRDFIQLDSVKELLSSHRSPLVYLTVMKKICDHPRLLSTKACKQLGLQTNEDSFSGELDEKEYEECAANRIDNISDKLLIEESAKLEFLIQLLLQLRKEGHRTLLFSLSRKILNIIQRILINHKFKIMRLDGLVTKLKEREKRVNLFQEDESYTVFLLTTQVGGVGLTLTGADRVVIYDPCWNPATDAQSVDRIYRIGQKKSVVIYRLITCGTIEEKIYRRQIFKNSMIQQSTCGRKDPFRYFSRQDLKELFVLDNVTASATQQQLEKLHAHQRNWDNELQEHVRYIHTLKMYGISDHDLMFTRKPDDFDYETEMANSQFNNKVEEAQMRLRMESDQFTGINEAELRWGKLSLENRGNNLNKKNEPVFPIDGLSEQLDDLNVPFLQIPDSSSDESNFSNKYQSSNEIELLESQNCKKETDQLNKPISIHSTPNLTVNSAPVTPTNQHLSDDDVLDSVTTSSFAIHHSSSANDDDIVLTDLNNQTFANTNSNFDRSNSPATGFDSNILTSEDELILAVDSPPPQTIMAAPSTNSINVTKELSFATEELTSDDELILGVDSPLLQSSLVAPSIKVTDAASKSFPTEIQESFTIFSDSESDKELDESWKRAFSLVLDKTSSDELPEGSNPSQQNASLIGPFRRHLLVVESDESESEGHSESLLKLANSSRRSMNQSTSQKRRSVSANMSKNCNPDSPSPLIPKPRFSIDSNSSSDQQISDETDLDKTEDSELNCSVLRDLTNGGATDTYEQSFQNLSRFTGTSKNSSATEESFSLNLSDYEEEI